MARVRRQRVVHPQEDQLAGIGSDPLPLRMHDNVPYNLFTSNSRCYVRPPSEHNPGGCARTCFGGCLPDMVQAHLLLQQPILANTAKIITDAVLVNLCLSMQPCADDDRYIQMYRCWVVHARSWRVVALQFVLWLSCFAALAVLVENDVKKSSKGMGAIAPIVFTSCHIVNNIYGTCMIPYHTAPRFALTIRVGAIVYKILRTAQTSSGTSRRLKKTSRILLESGILYTVSGVLNLVFQAVPSLLCENSTQLYLGCVFETFVCSLLFARIHDAQLYILFVQNFSMTGITFNLIIIRTGTERANTGNEFLDTQSVAERLRRLSGLLKPLVPRTRADSTSQSQDVCLPAEGVGNREYIRYK
jgi:hypothetical protein